MTQKKFVEGDIGFEPIISRVAVTVSDHSESRAGFVRVPLPIWLIPRTEQRSLWMLPGCVKRFPTRSVVSIWIKESAETAPFADPESIAEVMVGTKRGEHRYALLIGFKLSGQQTRGMINDDGVPDSIVASSLEESWRYDPEITPAEVPCQSLRIIELAVAPDVD